MHAWRDSCMAWELVMLEVKQLVQGLRRMLAQMRSTQMERSGEGVGWVVVEGGGGGGGGP